MTQQDRDRLVALKKAKKKLITQRQAAEELGQTERHVRRLLVKLRKQGDGAVVHARRGRPSNRKLDEKIKAKAMAGRCCWRVIFTTDVRVQQGAISGKPRGDRGFP